MELKLTDMDVVYIVREGEVNEELRYSLRSVAKNFPHHQVVIAGYCPRWVQNVRRLETNQGRLTNKYDKAELNWQAAMNAPDVTEDFMLFNDDFFIMKPVTEVPNYHRGDLDDVIAEYADKPGSYLENMLNTRELLHKLGLRELKSYALHAPMQMNKLRRKLLQTAVVECGYTGRDTQMRTLYGNFWRLGGERMPDVKATTRSTDPDKKVTFLSSSDDTFKFGKIGFYIREQFKEKCKYEV